MVRRTLAAAAVLTAVSLGSGGIAAFAAPPHHPAAKKHKAPVKTGPRGQRGAPGTNGKNGAAGATGAAGVNGGNGASGANGGSGAAGANGGSGAAGTSFLRTVIVSPTATTQTANGALLLAAVSGLGTVNSGNPALIWVEPGIYDIGTATLTLAPYTDLAGSGQDTTVIEGEGSTALSAGANTELREVTVKDTNAAGAATAISTAGGLRAVSARASGTSAAVAVSANTPSMPLVDVTAAANTSATSSLSTALEAFNTTVVSGGSFSANDSTGSGQAAALAVHNAAAVNGATLLATGGTNPYAVALVGASQTVKIIASTLTGSGGVLVPSGDTLDVGGSEIPGVITGVTGTAVCADDWLSNYVMAGSGCG